MRAGRPGRGSGTALSQIEKCPTRRPPSWRARCAHPYPVSCQRVPAHLRSSSWSLFSSWTLVQPGSARREGTPMKRRRDTQRGPLRPPLRKPGAERTVRDARLARQGAAGGHSARSTGGKDVISSGARSPQPEARDAPSRVWHACIPTPRSRPVRRPSSRTAQL